MALQVSYFAVLSLLSLYGVHRLWLAWVYLTRRGSSADLSGTAPPAGPDGWPVVTVQLPVYNERRVARRLIDAACALRYPEGRLEIQVLDDSTDETQAIAAHAVASYRARGYDIHHVVRGSRDGYKAGALAHALPRARGEVIAIFDADFAPLPDFLLRCVPRLMAGGDSRTGLVQARWGHLNRDASWLTRAQALLLDGHFVVEHGARRLAGRFLNFNGTAGVFRRECIEQAGGWQSDTLTEDLDLSYRAQLAGWRFDYLDEVEVPAELPACLDALRSQQRRWAKGSVQTALKLMPRLMRAPLPAGVKLEAAFHLTNNLPWLLTALLAALIVPALRARAELPWTYLALDLPLLLAGTGSFMAFCAVAQRRLRRDWLHALVSLPVVMAIGMGLSLNNALAVLDGLTGRQSPFHRTPKEGSPRPDGPALPASYRSGISPIVLLEGGFAAFFCVTVAQELAAGRWATLPFLALFAGGFVHVTLLTVAQGLSPLLTKAPRHAAGAPAR